MVGFLSIFLHASGHSIEKSGKTDLEMKEKMSEAWEIDEKEINKIEYSSFIIISKEEMALYVYDYKGNLLSKFPIAASRNYGNKEKSGDKKTPEGVFRISDIQDSSNWSVDFGDGNGKIKGVYGPFFIRLLTPGHTGIGIHGTHDNNSIGLRVTGGCIRLKNKDLKELVKLIRVGDVVVINPSKLDVYASSK